MGLGDFLKPAPRPPGAFLCRFSIIDGQPVIQFLDNIDEEDRQNLIRWMNTVLFHNSLGGQFDAVN